MSPRRDSARPVGPAHLFVLSLFAVALLGCRHHNRVPGPVVRPPPQTFAAAGGECLSCHVGIEDPHPQRLLYCTDCHAGDDTVTARSAAHVQPTMVMPPNPTILPVDYADLDYLRFLNPANLRIVEQTCGKPTDGFGGSCHADKVDRVLKSMMSTTAGHLAGGAYQNGILLDRQAIWSNMPVTDDDGEVPYQLGALAGLDQIPEVDTSFAFDTFERHYSDVPRKICTRCHLWSRGKAVRGVPGQEGNYRSEGCAACHMLYADDAISHGQDPTTPKTEVGHPVRHQLTREIPVNQCAHCHTRGARIGLSFQGLAQLPPGTPTGPGHPGLTPDKIYGAYHVQDAAVNPADIHFERGIGCIDCHVANEIMGDGNIYGHMDQATEIECQDCHGTPTAYGDLVTARNTQLDHVRIENGRYILRSKVDSIEHVIPQVKDIIDPTYYRYAPRGAAAMTSDHLDHQGGLECYTCHAAWQNNCYGCHFERDLRETALDYLLGQETLGHPRTDKKYFVNFKNFQMGYNAEGSIAPYTVGCQAMATVTDELGNIVLEQAMPQTAVGRSGLGLNAVNPHTTRSTPRFCVECHRSEPTLGTGSELFTLSRTHLFVAHSGTTPGLKILDRSDPAVMTEVALSPSPEPRGLVVTMDPVMATAQYVYLADGQRGLLTVDVRDPSTPVEVSAIATVDARHLAWIAGRLLLADGAGGLRIYDVTNAAQPVQLAQVQIPEARAVRYSGTYAYVAAGALGLVVVDVLDPQTPVVVATVDLNGAQPAANDASDVLVFSHYANPPATGVKPFSMLAYVADGAAGVRIVDIDEPSLPQVVATFATTDAQRLSAASLYDQGGPTVRSLEREYLYVADGLGGLRILDISQPGTATEVGSYTPAGEVTDVLVAHAFEPPDNKLYAYLSVTGRGLTTLDVGTTGSPQLLGEFPALVTSGVGLGLERIRLDRLVDETGAPIKDTSHEGARPFTQTEMERILRVVLPPF